MDLFLHDLAYQWGGAERVFLSLAKLNANAPVAVVAGNDAVLRDHFPGRSAVALYPRLASNRSARLATLYLARSLARRAPLDGRVTVSSFAVAKWVPAAGPRLVYSHSPMRQIWHGRHLYMRGLSPEALALRAFGHYLRSVDCASASPLDVVAVPSRRIADLTTETYGTRPSAVLPPPVDDEAFEFPIREAEDYYIWCGRIVEPIKRLALLFRAFARRPHARLLIVGDGRDRSSLAASAPKNVAFVGWLHGRELWDVVAGAQALLLPSMEDFGMVAAEALALGVPVWATHQAGISDWIRHGENGQLLEPTADSYADALGAQPDHQASRQQIRDSAAPFKEAVYLEGMNDLADSLGWV